MPQGREMPGSGGTISEAKWTGLEEEGKNFARGYWKGGHTWAVNKIN